MYQLLLCFPKPSLNGTDASYNEVMGLSSKFKGPINYLYPFSKPSSILPRVFYGMHKVPRFLLSSRSNDINHVVSPFLTWMPALSALKGKVIISLSSSLDVRYMPNIKALKKYDSIILNNERDMKLLQAKGLSNLKFILPGVDLSKIIYRPKPAPKSSFTLLMASAPWEIKQFYSKGLDKIFKVLQGKPELKLRLLWRGVCSYEIKKWIREANLENQIILINRNADINHELSLSDAAILLSNDPAIIKSFPHSLLESLKAGKPILTSDTIPISDFVRKHNCGLSLEKMTAEHLSEKLDDLRVNYSQYLKNVSPNLLKEFTTMSWLEKYRQIIETKINSSTRIRSTQAIGQSKPDSSYIPHYKAAADQTKQKT